MAAASGMSSSTARQTEAQEAMSCSSAQQDDPQEAMSCSSAQEDEPQPDPLEGLNCTAAQRVALRALQAAVSTKQEAAEKLKKKLWRCKFEYTPPEPDFDSRKVIGRVCNLIEVLDPINCIALEIAAGNRLFSVIVDEEPTSRLVLIHGNLQDHTTFIPLDIINGFVIDKKTVKFAQEIGGGPENVQLALDLVSYDSVYRKAMEWVFGNVLICRDAETAEYVAEHPNVRCRVVTLDGDIFEPNGTMTGGAKLKGRSLLAQVHKLRKIEEDLKKAEADLALYVADLRATQEPGEKCSSKKQKEIQKAEEELKRAKKNAEEHDIALKQREQELKTSALEVLELEQSVAVKKQQKAEYAASSALMHESLQGAEKTHYEVDEAIKEINSALERQDAKAAAIEAELLALVQNTEQLRKTNAEVGLNIDELDENFKKLHDEFPGWDKKYSLDEEKQRFRVVDGRFCFNHIDQVVARMDQLRKRKAELEIGLITETQYIQHEKEEKQYKNIMHQIEKEETKRAQLVQYIAKLDAKQLKKLRKKK